MFNEGNMQIELRCNSCHAEFPEEDAVQDEFCPSCGGDSLFEREAFNPIPVTCVVSGHDFRANQFGLIFCSKCGQDEYDEVSA